MVADVAGPGDEVEGAGVADAADGVAAAGEPDADSEVSAFCPVAVWEAAACEGAAVAARGGGLLTAAALWGGVHRRTMGAGTRGRSLTLAVATSGFAGVGACAGGPLGLSAVGESDAAACFCAPSPLG
ncbi:MAG TPA: hypothetical protein VEK07_24830 [Polyangiaceae bacterium]|nr:hypothetical protein [Polyangiaceae bacterium]